MNKQRVLEGIVFAWCSCAMAAVAASAPNILFVFTDDHAYQAVSAFASRINVTPNIDRLAQEGMCFDRCYVTNSVCGPCRAAILTGKYSHKNGFYANETSDFDGQQQTFPKLLQQAGYVTACIGKWHLGSAPTGFDHSEVLVDQGTYYNPKLNRNGQVMPHEGYATNIITDLALKWLAERDQSKPFMLMYQHKAPHRPWDPPLELLHEYDDVQIPEPPGLFEDYATRGKAVQTQDMTIAETMDDRDLKLTAPENLTPAQRTAWAAAYEPANAAFKAANLKGAALTRWKYQRFVKDYLRCVKSVDDELGRVLKYLDDHNLASNTLVVYCSDQGFYLGEHGWFDKRWMYEESLRTPLVARWPGVIEPGVRCNAIVSPIDFAATFLDAANTTVPADLQGASLKPLMQGQQPADWRTSFYYHYYEYPSWHYVRRHYGVTDGRFKLIHFYEPEVNEWEMYDLHNDRGELVNVFENPVYAHDRRRLEAELARQRQQLEVPAEDPPESKLHKAPPRIRPLNVSKATHTP